MPNDDYMTKVLGIKGFYVKDLVINESRIEIWIEWEEEAYCCKRCGANKYKFMGELGNRSKGFKDVWETGIFTFQNNREGI